MVRVQAEGLEGVRKIPPGMREAIHGRQAVGDDDLVITGVAIGLQLTFEGAEQGGCT